MPHRLVLGEERAPGVLGREADGVGRGGAWSPGQWKVMVKPRWPAATAMTTGPMSGLNAAMRSAAVRRPEHEWELTALDDVLVTRLDVQDADSIGAAVGAGLERFGRIDVLLNNAGYGAYGVLEATPMAKIRRQFDVNVLGLLDTTKAVLPHFAPTVRARSSTSPRVAVKIVEPGFVDTDFGGRSFDFTNDESLAEYQEFVGAFGATMAARATGGDKPGVVAEVVYRAATDGTDRLRYTAGPYAAELLAGRAAADDTTFIDGVRRQFGI